MPDQEQPREDAPSPEYSEDGVDLSLIRSMLALSVPERLAILEDHLDDILAIRKLNARG
jgi:hypothetical protein